MDTIQREAVEPDWHVSNQEPNSMSTSYRKLVQYATARCLAAAARHASHPTYHGNCHLFPGKPLLLHARQRAYHRYHSLHSAMRKSTLRYVKAALSVHVVQQYAIVMRDEFTWHTME